MVENEEFWAGNEESAEISNFSMLEILLIEKNECFCFKRLFDGRDKVSDGLRLDELRPVGNGEKLYSDWDSFQMIFKII